MNAFLHFKNKELREGFQKEIYTQTSAVFKFIKYFVIAVVCIEYAFKIYFHIRDEPNAKEVVTKLALDFIIVIAVVCGYLLGLYFKKKTTQFDRFIDLIYLILYCYGSYYITDDLFDDDKFSNKYEYVIMGMQSVWIQFFFFIVMKNWIYKMLLVLANILILSLRAIQLNDNINTATYVRGVVCALYTCFLLYINERIRKEIYMESVKAKKKQATFISIIKNIPETILMLNQDLTIAEKNNFVEKFFSIDETPIKRKKSKISEDFAQRNVFTPLSNTSKSSQVPLRDQNIDENTTNTNTMPDSSAILLKKLSSIEKPKLRDEELQARFLHLLFPRSLDQSLLFSELDRSTGLESAQLQNYNLLQIVEAVAKDLKAFKSFLRYPGEFIVIDMKFAPTFKNQAERSVELMISVAEFSDDLSDTDKIVLILRDTTQRDVIARLEDNNKYKDAVLASISHELRTPLNTNINSLQSVMLELNLNQNIKNRFITPALRNARLLLHLVNDILDLSQISTQRLKLNFENISIKDTILECMDLVEFQASMKELDLNYRIESGVPDYICTDPKRLSQILLNLVNNAVRFTYEGAVTIIASLEEDAVCFAVEDTGIGLTLDAKEKIVNMMEKLDSNQRIAIGSTGIGMGLNVANILAKMLGPIGKSGITIQSEEGKSSTFKFLIDDKPKGTMTLSNVHGVSTMNIVTDQDSIKYSVKKQFEVPSSQAIRQIIMQKKSTELKPKRSNSAESSDIVHGDESEDVATAYKVEKRDFGEKITQHLWKFMSHSQNHLIGGTPVKQLSESICKEEQIILQIQPDPKPEEPGCKCPQIMVIDDEPFNVMTLQQLLLKYKKNCIVAFNGKEAVKKLRSKLECTCPPGTEGCKWTRLIFMDKNMPIMDGIETTRAIKSMVESGELTHKFVVGNTAYVGQKEIDEFISAGIDEVLLKPLDRTKLDKAVAKYLDSKTV